MDFKFIQNSSIEVIKDSCLDHIYTSIQFRKPKTRKTRILKKFSKNKNNLKEVLGMAAFVVGNKILLCTNLYNKFLKLKIPKMDSRGVS